MKTKISFHGGLDTIGGNIVSIQYGNHRIISDFGALQGASLEELQNKEATVSLLNKQQLPVIEGVYTKKQLSDFDLTSFEESSLETIICLSHLHLDHIGSFGQLPETLPIYALQTSVDFYKKLSELSLLPKYQVNWQGVFARKTFEFGPFKIEFYDNDHDTLGAAAIFITTPDVKVIISGDFRLKGFHPEKVMTWLQAAVEFQPDLLLVEGTTFSFDTDTRDERNPLSAISHQDQIHSISSGNEWQMLNRFEALLDKYSDRLVAVNVYPQNMERLVYLAEAVNRAGRQLVLEDNFYELLKPYARTEIFRFDEVIIEKIKKSPKKFVVQVDYEQEHHTERLALDKGVYVHSNGVPLGSYDPRYIPFVQEVVDAGWMFYHAHVSGHATKEDLLLSSYVVRAGVTIPWHTFKPEVYAKALRVQGLKTAVPTYGKSYTLEDLQLLAAVGEEKGE